MHQPNIRLGVLLLKGGMKEGPQLARWTTAGRTSQRLTLRHALTGGWRRERGSLACNEHYFAS